MNSWASISKKLKIQNTIRGILVNRFDKRIKLSKEFTEFIKENEDVRELAFDTYIPENVRLKESEMEVPIAYYDTKCAGYLALKEWYKELQEREII
jgi:cellulose biosynthesis protein BcsQ